MHPNQISSRFQKNVIDCDYNYFQFMIRDYDYTSIFVSLITITSSLWFKILYLIKITKLLDYDCNLIGLNSLPKCWFRFYFKCIVYLPLYDVHGIIIYEWKTSLQYIYLKHKKNLRLSELIFLIEVCASSNQIIF